MPLERRILLFTFFACFALSVGIAAAVVDNDGGGDDDSVNSNDPQVRMENDREPNISKRGSALHPSVANPNLVDPTLNERSVVLITGAAGFLGSELALALRRTYDVKKLLLVDNLGIESENENAYVPPSPKNGDAGSSGAIYEKLSEPEMSQFEIKRQRAFRIFQELTSAKYPDDGGDSDDGNYGDERSEVDESIRFYRADMRPSIPEFFDFGEVPLLEGIFQSHPDITHVVHLADVPASSQNQAIPRNKDSIKTGRMEGLLEEMRLILERAREDGNKDVQLPQFVYASSHEVYDRISTAATNKLTPQQPNPPPFQEDKPITTPSSLHGTAKLIDEVLASAYHSTHGIYSVGLRFFPVYGPWNAQGTEVFDLAEKVAMMNDGSISEERMNAVFDEDVDDYVYIDDAVDAVLSAMQYRPPGVTPPPVVFNVGTGKGTKLREIRERMMKHYPKLSKGQVIYSVKENPAFKNRLPTESVASTFLSESLLGFKARVSLEEGLAHTMIWHHDRSFPYGRDPTIEESIERRSTDRAVADSLAKARGGDCSPLDRECLRGAPAFPCASECRREGRCTPSPWDDVVSLSKMVTSGCDAVLYTILLDSGAEQVPSASATASSEMMPYVGAGLPEDVGQRTQARCNIAFLSDRSPLVQRLRSEGEEYLDDESESNGLPPLLRHGFWTVLPVSTASLDSKSWMQAFDGTFALEYLPKASPGQFFGPSVRLAVYTDPTVLVEDLPYLLKRMESGPSIKNGSTVLMLAKKRQGCDPAQRGSDCPWTPIARNDSIQSTAYNMIRVALRGDILGGGLEPTLDSSLVMHLLRGEDSRLFRCDVYGEAAQWGVGSDERALEFIVSLHDLWSRAIVHWSGREPWWSVAANGDGVGIGAVDGGVSQNDKAKDEVSEKEGGNQRHLLESVGGDVVTRERAGSWMGILSSNEVQLFAQILDPDEMGIVYLTG